MTTFKNPIRLGCKTSRAYQKMLLAGFKPTENVKTTNGVFVTWETSHFSAVVLFSKEREVKAYTFFAYFENNIKTLRRKYKV